METVGPKIVLNTGLALLVFILLAVESVAGFRHGGVLGIAWGVFTAVVALVSALRLTAVGYVVWKGEDLTQPDDDDRLDATQAAALANVPSDIVMVAALKGEIPDAVQTDEHGYRFSPAGVRAWARNRTC